MRRLIGFGLVVCAAAAAGCRSDSTQPDYTLVTPLIETFQGTLDVKGKAFYSFVIGNPDPLVVTLASLTTSSGAAVPTTVTLGVGVPSGETCGTTFTTSTPAALVAQYAQTAQPGTYCVVISDPGSLTQSLNFAIRIKHS